MFLMRFTERAYSSYTEQDVRNSPNEAVRLTFSNSNFDPQIGARQYHEYLDEYEYCEEAGFEVPLRVWCMDLQTALSLVSVGEGVCIVPESVSSAPRKGMKFLKIEPEIARTALSLNYRYDEQGVHVQNFVRIAQKVARKVL